MKIQILHLIFLGGMIFIMSCDNQKMIERKFRKETFRSEPFQNIKKLEELTNFLLRNADTLVNYNQHTDYREIQLTEGSWYGHYLKTGDCFSIATFREKFISDYFPPALVDSFYNYLMQIESNFIERISLCKQNSKPSVPQEAGTIFYYLNYNKKDITDGTYYLTHGLYQNIQFTPNQKLKDEYDTLAKDTLIKNGLRYGIWVTPNIGW
jgi:hypothetical protein